MRKIKELKELRETTQKSFDCDSMIEYRLGFYVLQLEQAARPTITIWYGKHYVRSVNRTEEQMAYILSLGSARAAIEYCLSLDIPKIGCEWVHHYKHTVEHDGYDEIIGGTPSEYYKEESNVVGIYIDPLFCLMSSPLNIYKTF